MTFLVVALQSEARPLVEHFRLTGSDAVAPFRTYHGDRVSLVVTGVGRVACAAACAYLYARAGEPRNRTWLNVGIAGHRDLEVGTARLAHKVTDPATDRSWYPSLVFDPPAPTCEIATVDRPETTFATDCLYDMEAAAFFATATRFSLVELIHVLKVVSDNARNPAVELGAARVSSLVGEHVGVVEELVARSGDLVERLKGREIDLSPWTETRRFTVSQRRRLSDLLSRLAVLEGVEVGAGEYPDTADARELLAGLEERLRSGGARY